MGLAKLVVAAFILAMVFVRIVLRRKWRKENGQRHPEIQLISALKQTDSREEAVRLIGELERIGGVTTINFLKRTIETKRKRHTYFYIERRGRHARPKSVYPTEEIIEEDVYRYAPYYLNCWLREENGRNESSMLRVIQRAITVLESSVSNRIAS